MTPFLEMFLYDLHTHNADAPVGQALVNLTMTELMGERIFTPKEGAHYSAGIFPLFDGDWEKALLELHKLVAQPWFRAIGECGLDKRSTTPLIQQTKFLSSQLELAAKNKLPVILHCVQAWAELIAIHRQVAPNAPRIIHGFRGKPQLAAQLLDAGFHLSFGPHFNPESLRLCPPELRHIETDDSKDFSINDVWKLQEKFLCV